jgi:NitT/TauT family transport system substrate-binding protein
MRNISSWSFLRSAVVAAALICVASPAVPVAAQSTPVIRLGTGPDQSVTPILYAISAGIYKKYGITVEPVAVGSGSAAAAALAGGSVDIAKTSAIGTITAVAKGLPFTAIGSLGHYESARPNYALLVLSDGPIKAPDDLAGKTFASLSLVDQNSVSTQAWLDAHHVDRSTIKYLEVPPSASLAALEARRIDAVTTFEPFYSQMVESGKARVLGFPMDAVARRFPDTLMFAKPDWVNANRATVDKFLRATREAAAYVSTHENETLPLLVKFLNLDAAALGHQHFPPRGVGLTAADLQPVIDAAAKYGVIPNVFPAQQMICGCALKN